MLHFYPRQGPQLAPIARAACSPAWKLVDAPSGCKRVPRSAATSVFVLGCIKTLTCRSLEQFYVLPGCQCRRVPGVRG
jgi:hypothetical protein